MAAYIGSVLVDACMSHCSGVERPEDGVTAPKHVGAVLI